MAYRLTERLSMLFAESITGPYSPAIDRIADHHIRKFRLSVKKDRNLSEKKRLLKTHVAAFEKDSKYEGYITIDVDPL